MISVHTELLRQTYLRTYPKQLDHSCREFMHRQDPSFIHKDLCQSSIEILKFPQLTLFVTLIYSTDAHSMHCTCRGIRENKCVLVQSDWTFGRVTLGGRGISKHTWRTRDLQTHLLLLEISRTVIIWFANQYFELNPKSLINLFD